MEAVRLIYEDTSGFLAISTQNQTSHCRLSAFPGTAFAASFICCLNMRKEDLEKEENGCLQCKCSPQTTDCNCPELSKSWKQHRMPKIERQRRVAKPAKQFTSTGW